VQAAATSLVSPVGLAGFAALLAAALGVSCGGRSTVTPGEPPSMADASASGTGDTGTDLGFADGGTDAPTFPDAGCLVEIDSPPLMAAAHVPIGTTIQWDSNPPSSGPHYPIWAAYQAYTTPVPRGYYVHDEEHGGVVLLYACADPAGCPDVAAALQSVSDAIADDPLCTQAGEGVRVRTVITPDPLLDVPVAAAAWGWVYRAQCVDLPTLTTFALQHYGQGPEVLCSNGTTQF
jgi:hypothetical protein